MKKTLELIYNYFFIPVAIAAVYLVSISNSKLRKWIKERQCIFDKAKVWKSKLPVNKKVVIIHCASMGEFEHIKPLIAKFSKNKNVALVITFFSDSGYENVKQYEGVDLFLYLPFDRRSNLKKLYSILKPALLIISKHDIWPNQVWVAKSYGIPVFLINGSLSANSSRLKPPVKFFLKYIYRYLDGIFTVSPADTIRFKEYFPESKIKFIGDTKFDQVTLRREQARKKELLPRFWYQDNLILLFGSIWPEDAAHILPALKHILTSLKKVRAILVPHQPEPIFIERIEQSLGPDNCSRFSNINVLREQPVIIVDRIGVLADLYKYGNIAYVGGSFKQGIHNVMEAAVYGIPVLYGPKHINSSDAIDLLQEGGSLEVHNAEQLQEQLKLLINDENRRHIVGNKAADFANKNIGATDKLIREWQPYLS